MRAPNGAYACESPCTRALRYAFPYGARVHWTCAPVRARRNSFRACRPLEICVSQCAPIGNTRIPMRRYGAKADVYALGRVARELMAVCPVSALDDVLASCVAGAPDDRPSAAALLGEITALMVRARVSLAPVRACDCVCRFDWRRAGHLRQTHSGVWMTLLSALPWCAVVVLRRCMPRGCVYGTHPVHSRAAAPPGRAGSRRGG